MAMSPGLLIFIAAIAVVGLFVIGMSLTLIFKGRHIDSEIGTNKNMRERGIKCTSQQFREEERALHGRGRSGLRGQLNKGGSGTDGCGTAAKCGSDMAEGDCGDAGCAACGMAHTPASNNK